MQGWQNELKAQQEHGRSQLENTTETVTNRPFDQIGIYPKSRQFGGAPRYQRESVDSRERAVGGQGARLTGHLAFLKSLQRSSATIRLLTIHDEAVIGVVKDCDEITITLRVPCATESNPDAYQNRVFFKQNLVEFAPVVEGVTFS